MAFAIRPWDPSRVTAAIGPGERRWFDRRAAPLYVIVAAQLLVLALAIGAGTFTYDASLPLSLGRDIGWFLLLAVAARWLGFDRIAMAVELPMLFLATVFLGAFVSVVLAASALPLADGWLARCDRLLFGFDQHRFVRPFLARPWLMKGSIWIYGSLAFTPALLAASLVLTRRTGEAWTLLIALTLAMTMAMIVMPLVPAHGAENYSFDAVRVFDGVRAGHLRHLDASVMTGLVVFPSLHAADAVILAHGFARVGRWGKPFVLLNLLMIVSAIVVGGHYLTDIVAGLGVAWAALRLARACSALTPGGAPAASAATAH